MDSSVSRRFDAIWARFGHEGTNHDDAAFCEADPDPVARRLEELSCVDEL